jgi:hypothetical protein
MLYDPQNASSRRHLAACVLQTVLDAGFVEEWHGEDHDPTKERVFYRPVEQADGTPVDGIRVLVYTSIVGEEVRTVGKDAIRVVAVYRSQRTDRERGIIKETRVHRVGDTDDICDRLLGRMRAVYGRARRPNRCSRCGAPTFTSKKGNDVCADLCWKSEDEINGDGGRPMRSRRWYGGRRQGRYAY